MEKKLLKILICINCLGTLQFSNKKLKCNACNKQYEVIDRIPIMLKEDKNLMLKFKNKRHPITKFQFNALDVACGIEPTGDVNVDTENIYLKYGIRPQNFIIASATALPFKNKSFKTANVRWLLEHLKDEEVLMTIKEVERVAERAIFVVPNAYFVPGSWKYSCTAIGTKYREIMLHSPHIQIFNEKMLRELLKGTFKNVRIYGEGTWIEIPILEKFFSLLAKKIPFFSQSLKAYCE